MLDLLAAALLAAPAPAPAAPGVIMLRCHMMECGWYRPLTSNAVRQGEGWSLLRVTARHGISVHRPGRRGGSHYPARYRRGLPIRWDAQPRVGWVLCSPNTPVSIFRSEDGTWIAHKLNLFDLPGFAESSAYIYLDACHGLGRDALEDQPRLRELGYSDSEPSQQLELRTPEEILEHLPR